MACGLSCMISNALSLLAILSLPVYATVLAAIVQKRQQLPSSFYSIFLSVGVADLSTVLARFLFRGVSGYLWYYFPQTRDLIDTTFFQTLSNMIAGWGLYYVSVSGLLVLSINRLYSLNALKTKGEGWSSRTTRLAILFQWLWVFPFSLPQVLPCCRAKLKENVTFRAMHIDKDVKYWFWTADIIWEGFIVMPILIAVHVIMIYKIMKYQKLTVVASQGPASSNKASPQPKASSVVRPASNPNAKPTLQVPLNQNWVASRNSSAASTVGSTNLTTEMRFVVLGAVLCGGYVVMVFNYTIGWLNGGGYVHYIQAMFVTVSQTVFFNANPILLLGLSPTFRKIYIQFMTFGKYGN